MRRREHVVVHCKSCKHGSYHVPVGAVRNGKGSSELGVHHRAEPAFGDQFEA